MVRGKINMVMEVIWFPKWHFSIYNCISGNSKDSKNIFLKLEKTQNLIISDKFWKY